MLVFLSSTICCNVDKNRDIMNSQNRQIDSLTEYRENNIQMWNTAKYDPNQSID